MVVMITNDVYDYDNNDDDNDGGDIDNMMVTIK